MRFILSLLALFTFGTAVVSADPGPPVAAAAPAAQPAVRPAVASLCYTQFVYSGGVAVGGKTHCAYPSPWEVVVGCSGRYTTNVVAQVQGPIFYSSLSYAYCPAKAPNARWAATYLPAHGQWSFAGGGSAGILVDRVYPAVSAVCHVRYIALGSVTRRGASGWCETGAYYIRVGCAPNAKYTNPTIYYYGPRRSSKLYGESARYCPPGAPFARSALVISA